MKIAIVCPGARGDIAMQTSVLVYAHELWGDFPYIVWYAAPENFDMLAGKPHIQEVQPWDGSILKPKWADWMYLATSWLAANDRKTRLAIASRQWFGVALDKPWHPCLEWTIAEEDAVARFMASLPQGRVNIMLETRCGSNQSAWDAATTAYVLKECRKRWPGRCNFLMASNLQRTLGDDTFSCAQFTVRNIVPVYNRCHVFIGCSSGISVATCCWRANPAVKRLLYIRDEWASLEGVAWLNREVYSLGWFLKALHDTLDEVTV